MRDTEIVKEKPVTEAGQKSKKRVVLSRILAVLIVTAIFVLLRIMSGCGSAERNDDSSKNSAVSGQIQDAGKIVSQDDESITVIDQAGREVEAPKGVQSIAISYRVVARFVITLGDGDKIKGIGKTEEFLYELAPSLKDAVDVGKGVPDLEALAELAPDIYFHKATDIDGLDRVKDLGIPAVGLSFENPEEMKTALTIMGAVLGKQDRAQDLIAYYDERIDADKEEAEKINDKKSAIVMGSSLGKVADGSMLQSAMIEYAGGISPAADMEATELWPTAGTEQIFKWDPDYIFITGSEGTNYGPEDIFKDKAWAELKAVKNKHVYVMPAQKDSWEFPGVVSVLGIDFMKSKMYPELLPEEQLQENIDAFYEMSYGRTFTAEEIGY